VLPACSRFSAAKDNKVVEIAIVEAGLDHKAGFWIKNTISRGDGLMRASVWEYPPMRAFLLEVGAGSITVDQCMLGGPDAVNNSGVQKSTTIACDIRLAPHLQRLFGGLKKRRPRQRLQAGARL
jgi:hypothetical protein